MNSACRMTWFIVVCTMGLVGCTRSDPDKSHENRAAAALFERFETVAYTDAKLLSDAQRSNQLPDHVKSPLRLPFYFLLGALDSLDSQAKHQVLASANAVLVGAKEFGPPKGLGPVHSKRCYVVALGKRGRLDFRKYIRQSPASTVAEATIWNWSAKLGEFGELDPMPSSLYASQIDDSYLVLANSLEEVTSVVERLSQTKSAELMKLNDVRDWAVVSQYEMWGYRRYRQVDVADRTAAGLTYVAPGAQALYFVLDSKKKSFTMRLFCVPGEERTPGNINATGLFGRLKWSSGGVWEKTLPLEGDFVEPRETLERLGAVMGMLGFGLYVFSWRWADTGRLRWQPILA